MFIAPLALSVVKLPAAGVVAPITVLFRPVEVRVKFGLLKFTPIWIAVLDSMLIELAIPPLFQNAVPAALSMPNHRLVPVLASLIMFEPVPAVVALSATLSAFTVEVRVISPLAPTVVNAPVVAVVAPSAVLFRPVAVRFRRETPLT